MSRLRLLHVTPYIVESARFGGIPTAVRTMCEALAKDGHSVTVWASDAGREDLPLAPLEATEIRIKLHATRFKALSRTLNSPIVPTLMKVSSDTLSGFDVVHLHGYWVTFAPFFARACLKAHKPLVLQPHGSLVESNQRMLFKKVFQLMFRSLLIKATNTAIALSPAEEKQLRRNGFPASRVTTIPNASPIAPSEMPTADEARDALKLPRGSKIVLYLGRLHKSKGLNELLKAHRAITEITPDSVLVIAGPDEGVREELVGLANSLGLRNVRFLGAVDPREKWVVLRAADVFCLPSAFEGVPMTVLEAAEAGVAIVLSNKVAIPGFEDGQSIVSSKPTAASLTTSISRLFRDPELRLRIAQGARTVSLERFAPEVISSQLKEVYDKAIRGSPSVNRHDREGWSVDGP